jgi:hypothetical protein
LCDRKATELKSKLDELDSLKLEHEAMDSMKKRDTLEARRIDQLKIVRRFPLLLFCLCNHPMQETEQVENEITRSQHYRRQLDYMLSRLKKNQVILLLFLFPNISWRSLLFLQIKFDAHMNGMEDTYLSVKHEWEEVQICIY